MGKLPPQTVEKSRKLARGTYRGRVLGWESTERETQPGKVATYVDLNIGVQDPAGGEPIVLPVGYPFGRLTPDSLLAKFFGRFGLELNVGATIDTEAELNKLINRNVLVDIYVERKTNNGQTQEFSRIDRDSVRPDRTQ
jgi:hypothetical protein